MKGACIYMKVSTSVFGTQLKLFLFNLLLLLLVFRSVRSHIGGLFSKLGGKIGVCTPEQHVLLSALPFFCVLFLESILTKSYGR